MRKGWIFVGLLILSILPGLLVADTAAAAVNITVDQNSATVVMRLIVQENLSALPIVSVQINPTNSSSAIQLAAQPISSTIQKLVPGARLASLDLSINTSNNTGMYKLEEDYTMIVTGANVNSGSIISSNLGFIKLNETSPIQLGGIEVNNIGQAILLPMLQAKTAEFSNLKYYIDGSNPTTSFIPEQTTKVLSLLDFTWIPPFSAWTENRDILGQSTSWALNPANPRYNLTIGPSSPENTLLKVYTAIYNPSISLSIPSTAWINGNTVSFDLPTPTETLMPLIITASLVVAIVALALDRKTAGPIRTRKKR